MTEKAEMVDHPAYYTDGKIEVIAYIEDKHLGFCLGNAASTSAELERRIKARKQRTWKKQSGTSKGE